MPYARAVGPSGHVTGADISRPMLEAARRRVDEHGLTNVELILADAQVHAFAPESYDLLTSRLGVMFFADPVAAFRNLIRALRPGGRLVLAVWATIDENTHWKIPFEIAVRHLGAPAPLPPHAPGPHAFGDRDYLRGILDAAGFDTIAIEPRQFKVRGDYPAGMAEHAAQFGLVQRLIDEKQADDAARRGDCPRHRGGFRRLCDERGCAAAGDVPARQRPPAGVIGHHLAGRPTSAAHAVGVPDVDSQDRSPAGSATPSS